MIRNAGGKLDLKSPSVAGWAARPSSRRSFALPGEQDLLSSFEGHLACLNNSHGRRDNIYKARIKILVHDLGIQRFAAEVDEEWSRIKDG